MEHAMEHVAELCILGGLGQAPNQLFGELERFQEAIKTSQLTRVCQADQEVLVIQSHARRRQRHWFYRLRAYNVVRLHAGHCSRAFRHLPDSSEHL